MKRISSLNNCGGTNPANNASLPDHQTRSAPSSPEDDLIAAAALAAAQTHSSQQQPQQHQHHHQQRKNFRQWESMSIDRTHAHPQRQHGSSVSGPVSTGMHNHPSRIIQPPPFSSSSSATSNNKKSGQNTSTNRMSPEERKTRATMNTAGFLSDPSISEEEFTETGSSQADFHKKLMYRQKLREFDASSLDNTSLSSSNMSPTPQKFRIQFESGSTNSSSKEMIQGKTGKMRNKIKAVGSSARLSISSMIQSETTFDGSGGIKTKVHGSNNGEVDYRKRSSLDGTEEDILQAALMPPTRSSNAADAGAHDNTSLLDQKVLSNMTSLPSLGGNKHNNDTGSHESSADSVQDISITTMEQSGGEHTSSSALQNPDAYGITNATDGATASNTNSPPTTSRTPSLKSQPDADLAKRATRKLSPRRRMRSGDAVAAIIMNSGQEDWIGMNLDNIPIPELNDNDGSSALLARKENHSSWSNESTSLFASMTTIKSQGNSRRRSIAGDGSRDGYSSGSSAVTNNRTPPLLQHVRPQRANSTLSGDTFDFSDSAAESGLDLPHAHSFDQNHQNRQWNGVGGGHHARHASSFDAWGASLNPEYMPRVSSYQQGTRKSHSPEFSLPLEREESNSAYASQGGTPMMNSVSNILEYMPWVSSYQQGMQNSPSAEFSLQIESEESNSTSGSSATCISSPYTDNSDGMMDIDALRQPLDSHSVKFVPSPKNEDRKFDMAMKRLKSMLDKPYHNKIDKVVDNNVVVPMFYCPNCKEKQRDFINFATASGIYDTPQGYLAAYFALYIGSALFVFGLEEGWAPLDCVYFAVITLTTAGLGDLVPSTDRAKIVCALFIYISVATIGLLLGSLLTGNMDKAHKKEAREAQIRDCPSCLRLEKIRLRSMAQLSRLDGSQYSSSHTDGSSEFEGAENIGPKSEGEEHANKSASSIRRQSQIHTRHMSIDVGGNHYAATKPAPLRHIDSCTTLPTPIDEARPFFGRPGMKPDRGLHFGMRANAPDLAKVPSKMKSAEMRSSDASYSTSSSDTQEYINPSKTMTRVKAAKYIISTMKDALVNSLYIITAGSFGFYYIEKMSAVDSFYFTTVLLTGVGYGDIVPVTTAGKVFATIFSIVAGTVLLRNMTLISMIPLELRKRRVERAVLGQFGTQLNDDALHELSTGRLINRLKLATDRPDGLEECTREMFSLAMLVRLGRITEHDVTATFAAFRRLDTGNYGKLNSRTIIEGELMMRKSLLNTAALSQLDEEWKEPIKNHPWENVSQVHHGSPNPFMNPLATAAPAVTTNPGIFPSRLVQPISQRNLSHDSPRHSIDASQVDYDEYTNPGMFSPRLVQPTRQRNISRDSSRRSNSIESYYSQGMVSHASQFDYDEYERWVSNFYHYSSPPTKKSRKRGPK